MVTRRLNAELVMNTAQANQALAAFGQNIGAMQRQLRTLSAASSAVASGAFGGASSRNLVGGGGALSTEVSAIANEYVKVGNTIKTVSQLQSTLIDSSGRAYNVLSGQVTTYAGNLDKVYEAERNLTAAYEQRANVTANLKNQQQGLLQAYHQQEAILGRQIFGADARGEAARQRQGIAQQRIDAVTAQRSVASQAAIAAQERVAIATAAHQQAAQALLQQRANYDAGFLSQRRLNPFIQNEQSTYNDLQAANHGLTLATRQRAEVISSTTNELRNAQRQLVRATQSEANASTASANAANAASSARRATISSLLSNARADRSSLSATNLSAAELALFNARTATPGLPSTISYLQGASPNLLTTLERAGLGQPGGRPLSFGATGVARGSEDYIKNLISQDAYEGINIQKDLVRQVTRVSGSFKDSQGIVQQFNAEFDKSGRVITRFGSQLSGIGSIFNSLARDFQKVIEFAVATTVVFGALRFAIQELETITEIDKSIRQLGITSNQTRAETLGLFEDLADVATLTATPLKEMIKAADDIALATRKAGQSTEDWNRDIINLSQSVGILTNLAGIDTVKATDLLVSTMKQLNIEAENLPTILNKVTAVAGGQSAAIADIVTGLGALAEAGQQGALSLDQMIATVQTLSQATSKTPAEVATALKNLIGALGGPAGTKALKEYDIALKDNEGNLRNIIDVYTEIQQKIERGVIPESDVQALVRAIAGGPRRAPDAAALLSVIDGIQEAARRSANATNDAFLANAKVLDTVDAKLIQIQTRIDKFAVTKFATIIREVSVNFLDLLNTILNIAEIIPPQLVVTVVQFGALLAIIKLGTSVGKILINTVVSMGLSFKELALSIGGATGALGAFNRAAAATPAATGPGTTIPLGPGAGASSGGLRLGSFARGLAGPAVFGAIGAGLSAAGGANPAQILGGGLQSAGIALLLSPVPLPHAKALGLALAGVGTGIQFVSDQLGLFKNNADQATEAVDENAEAVLNAYAAYKEASIQLETVQTRQDALQKTLDEVQAKSPAKRTADDLALLNNTQKEYAETVVKVVDATNALNAAYEQLSSTLEGGDFAKYQIDAARAGLLDDEGLQQLIRDLSVKFIQQTNPDFQPPGSFELPSPVTSPGQVPVGPTTAQIPQAFRRENPQTLEYETYYKDITIDLENLGKAGNDVTRLFDENGKVLADSFAATPKNLDLVRSGLEAVKDSIDPEKYRIMSTSLNDLASVAQPLTALQGFVEAYAGYLNALQVADPFIKPEDIDNAKSLLNLYEALTTLAQGPDFVGTGTFLSPDRQADVDATRDAQRAAAQEGINRILTPLLDPKNGAQATKEDLIELAKYTLILQGEFGKLGDESLVFDTAAELAKQFNLEVAGLNETIANSGLLLEDYNEALSKIKQNFADLIDQQIGNVVGKSADLQAQFDAGEIKGPKFEREQGDVHSYIQALKQLKNNYNDLAETSLNLGDDLSTVRFAKLGDEAKSFAKEISNISGLEDATRLSTQELVERMLKLGETYDLNGRQSEQLVRRLGRLIKALDTISRIKAEFSIGADVSQAIKALKAMRASMAALAKAGMASGYVGGPSGLSTANNNLGALDAAINELVAAQNTVKHVGGGLGGLFRAGSSGGGGGSGGGAGRSRARAGKDVSTIDLPDEIADAANRDKLIREAIRRARKLQDKIPGENKEAKNDIVELLKGTQRILEVRGVKDDYLRKALEELAEVEQKRLEQETKADTIRRIRVGGGDFAAIANVPVNSRTGISLGGPEGPINITLNLNGTVLTPAQFAQFADQIAAALKKQLSK